MNKARLLLAGALLGVAGGCGGGSQSDATAPNGQTNVVAEAPTSTPAATASLAAPAAAGSGCAAAMVPELDRESIVQALGQPAPTQARLDAFKIRAGEAFKAAADGLCRSGKLAPGLLKSFSTIIIQNGAGATETAVYEDPHDFRSEDLIFQWTFAEADLEIPDQDDISMGISCWNDPDQPSCAEREP